MQRGCKERFGIRVMSNEYQKLTAQKEVIVLLMEQYDRRQKDLLIEDVEINYKMGWLTKEERAKEIQKIEASTFYY